MYPSYRVRRFPGHASYFLIASPTNCVEFIEERKAGNEFGFTIRTLKSRPVVKDRERDSVAMDKSAWFAEVRAAMLAQLDCAAALVEICNAIRYSKGTPTIGDYRTAADEAAEGFESTKRSLATKALLDTGDAVDVDHARLMLGFN
ncbi:hypothetical protein [Roseateles asaccharophilus]|uniref:hypothetical protein n=1 Tax=Roseateles asaccharophilus TaxID=582607 RepID=UPI00384D9B48